MFKVFSTVAVVFLMVVVLISTTPFIGYLLDGTPERLAPSIIGYVFLIVSYFIWRNAKRSSSWPILNLAMAVNFLSLILVCWSWIGVPFVDAIFLIIGNGSLVFFIVSLILSLVSFLITRKSFPNHSTRADSVKIAVKRKGRARSKFI